VTLKVVATIPVGPDPHEVIASSDGKMAYVSNMGNGETSFHELNVLDRIAQKALPSVDTGPLLGLHGLAYAGGKVWFTAQEAKALGRYDPASGKVDWIFPGAKPHSEMDQFPSSILRARKSPLHWMRKRLARTGSSSPTTESAP
jgi:DNA-binding beta-propeller fold protein YncE